jgi:hypothetical protein
VIGVVDLIWRSELTFSWGLELRRKSGLKGFGRAGGGPYFEGVRCPCIFFKCKDNVWLLIGQALSINCFLLRYFLVVAHTLTCRPAFPIRIIPSDNHLRTKRAATSSRNLRLASYIRRAYGASCWARRFHRKLMPVRSSVQGQSALKARLFFCDESVGKTKTSEFVRDNTDQMSCTIKGSD